MKLPIERCHLLEKRIELSICYGLHQRERHGKELNPVILEQEKERDYLGISALSTPPCALYYQLSDVMKDESDIASQFGFDTGHVLESYVLDLLDCEDRQGELLFPYEMAPGGVIKGHYDGRLTSIMEGGACIIEVKATGGYSFGKKAEEGADQGHVEQAFSYASRSGSPYFVVIYCNREAKKSTAFYFIQAFYIPDMQAAEQAVQSLFDERFAPVLAGLWLGMRPDQPAAPRHEFGARGWRCRPDGSYFARGKEQQQVGYCSFRGICPEARQYAEKSVELVEAEA
jgi:hypothetical protein